MKILREAHRYELPNFEAKEKEGQIIQFIEKDTDPSGDGKTVYTISDGTTTEEVLEVIIDRLTVMNKKFPCRENSVAITNLETALLWLHKRTADRIKRKVEGKMEV